MPLPEFNPSGTGPQGVGGISPEEIARVQRQLGSEANVEDTVNGRRILDNEVRSVAEQLGMSVPRVAAEPEGAAAAQREEQVPGPSRQGDAARRDRALSSQPSGESRGSQAAEDDPLRARLREIRKITGGDFLKLAQLYVETEDKARGADDEKRRIDAERAELAAQRDELGRLRRHVDSLTFGDGGAMGPRSGAAAPRQEAPVPAERKVTPEEFFSDPMKHIGTEIQAHLGAFAEAFRQKSERDETSRYRREHQAEIDKHRAEMVRLYESEPEVYDILPPQAATNLLLRQAKDRMDAAEARNQAERMAKAFKDVMDLAGDGPLAGADGRGSQGSVPMGGSSSASLREPGREPTQDWSSTKSMRELWRAGDGSTNETRLAMEILKERGHGSHIT